MLSEGQQCVENYHVDRPVTADNGVSTHYNFIVHHHRHVPEGLGMLSCSLILKMKLVPPFLPRSSYVSSSFWFIL